MYRVMVVVPIFNRIEPAMRAIRSVANQSWRNIDLVAVDDGSSESLEPVQQLVEEAGGRWLRLTENRGVAAARNAGVGGTGADWICFLDSDDEWFPGKVEKQLSLHRENRELRISQVGEEWVRNGKTVRKPDHWEPPGGDLFADSIERCSISPSCVMMRRDLWEETGGFDEAFPVCEDYDLWLRITRAEPVGKVGGAPLARKYGGDPDQLSMAVPAMDRHRILALLNLLANDGLSEEQRALVIGGVRRKAEIVVKGAEKRGESGRAEVFRKIGEWAAGAVEVDRVGFCEEIRAEIASSDLRSRS